jgi:hypothetical protein
MNLRDMKIATDKYIIEHSTIEIDRQYVGISASGKCPRMIYNRFNQAKTIARWREAGSPLSKDIEEMLKNMETSIEAHLKSMSGYMYEKKMLEILVGSGIAETEPLIRTGVEHSYFEEILAPIGTTDIPVIGHTDGRTKFDGNLIEIKTFSPAAFQRLTRSSNPAETITHLYSSYSMQIQGYMRYGNYKSCLFVPVSRGTGGRDDPFAYAFIQVDRSDAIGTVVERRLLSVVRAIEKQIPPECECGRCR